MKHQILANKGKFWIYIACSLLLPLFVGFTVINSLHDLWYLIPTLIPCFLFVWVYFSTTYYIDAHYFYYQSAFIKGKIEIIKIKEIQLNKTLWSGLKPALATKGMIIKFGYDEIYVAPINNQQLVQALLKVNSNIIIK